MSRLATNLCRAVLQVFNRPSALTCTCRSFHGSLPRAYSVFEPDDVITEPEIPEYDTLNIRMRGYDFVQLESFSKYVHNLVMNMSLENNMFPVPARTAKVQSLKTFSSNVEHEYELAVYERTVQVEDLPSTLAPILFEVLQHNIPEGVSFTVKEPDEEEEEFRFVPDLMLLEMQSQMEELDQAKEDRKKK